MKLSERIFTFILAFIIAITLWLGVNYKGSELGRKISEGLKRLEQELNRDTDRPSTHKR